MANKRELLEIVEKKGRLQQAKEMHRTIGIMFEASGLAIYYNKGEYTVAVEGTLHCTARQVCIMY